MALKIKEPIIVVIEYVCNKLAMFLPFVPVGLIYTHDEIIKITPKLHSKNTNLVQIHYSCLFIENSILLELSEGANFVHMIDPRIRVIS